MNKITIFIPISRHNNIVQLFNSLELLDCRKDNNLFVIVDGDIRLYTEVRNLVESSKFAERLCVHKKQDGKQRQFSILNRRSRIAQIHEESKQYLNSCDYVLGIEDDTLIPKDALNKLLRIYSKYPYAGFVQGVEIGRWGIPYFGAWKIDNIYEPTEIESLPKGDGVQEIDAGGFYCYLTTFYNYTTSKYETFDNNSMGPDFQFGINLRQQGLKNYMDWSIDCGHICKDKIINMRNTETKIVGFHKISNRWRQKPIK